MDKKSVWEKYTPAEKKKAFDFAAGKYEARSFAFLAKSAGAV